MAVPVPGPCQWPIDTTCCPDWDGYSTEVKARATTFATSILDALTGHQFAQCPVNYRPCGPRCAGGGGYVAWPVGTPGVAGGGGPWMIPYVDAGVWRNCGCTGGCSCAARCEVPFPTSVASVASVAIDGVELDPTAYRLDSWRGRPMLVRIDGDCWPQCQDMDAAAGEVGAFVITYSPGRPLPVAGQIAAGEYACEIAKACVGADCALPQQVASMTRNGVDLQIVDPVLVAEDGLTGLANVDLWIRSVNPARRAQRSRVASVDTYRGRFS
ncbi:hypothetical protein L1085_009680 [Streptomyces sp. MSC1_001]|jgi:hypothetical protein|uniref:hypothetical protein n=1 Tax=Streptomyces sp. MSC1_001 TaxID=2909263 RepID=UPI00202F9DC7|nr:hypothetical protein [Streptomyces sp. MSC1_001]